jgi:hypothetical protein
MGTLHTLGHEISCRVLEHLLQRIDCTPAVDTPFAHIYLEDVFPPELYARLVSLFPAPELYQGAAERHYGKAEGEFVRSMFLLTPTNLASLSADQQALWWGIAVALTAPELKVAMFAKMAGDLAFRYGVPRNQVGQLAGYSRPTLYRETEGFEIAPHPDTRKKVVTMHLYLPTDESQTDLGTALYQRNFLGWPLGNWKHRFTKVKQFAFRPNSGYAFVVNNKLTKKSWHGREKLPTGAGVRNTLLNTFYESPREGFTAYRAAA